MKKIIFATLLLSATLPAHAHSFAICDEESGVGPYQPYLISEPTKAMRLFETAAYLPGDVEVGESGVVMPSTATSESTCIPITVERPIEEYFNAEDAPTDYINYDVPVELNERVERFMDYFQTRGRKFFRRWLERSTAYLPMTKEILGGAGLPEDLSYLALIESGFNPHARSRANAVGVWQFMRWTGKKYGLRVDWWIDERKDPEKATWAASRYLSDLYERFGSWYIAAASYNAGEGRIMRAMRKHDTEDYWELTSYRWTLKRETRNYVPKYLAALMIAKDPEKYGFTEIEYRAPLDYEKVKISEPTDLKVIARAAETSVQEVIALNPELKRWFTPPNYPDYELKLPPGSAEKFYANIESIPKNEWLRFYTHRVRQGESLWTISRRYGTPISEIVYLNKLRSSRFIRAGSKLVIPIRASSGSRKMQTASMTPQETIPSSGVHTVSRGDTLWEISLRYGIPIKDLMQWNDLRRPELIRPGQELILKEALLSSRDKGA